MKSLPGSIWRAGEATSSRRVFFNSNLFLQQGFLTVLLASFSSLQDWKLLSKLRRNFIPIVTYNLQNKIFWVCVIKVCLFQSLKNPFLVSTEIRDGTKDQGLCCCPGRNTRQERRQFVLVLVVRARSRRSWGRR